MSKIKLRNFGPIKDGLKTNHGWVDIPKVTVFIGNQGSGKSTVAKLISTFTWIEKALVRGDYNKSWFEKKDIFESQFLKYHRVDNYLIKNQNENTSIEYKGVAFNISYFDGKLEIIENNPKAFQLPQIMYVPAERNILSYLKSPKELKFTSDALKEFLTEFEKAKNSLSDLLNLPINNVKLEYDSFNDSLKLNGENFKLNLGEASSGFQSLVPLYLVSFYLANTVKKQSETNKEPMSNDEMKRFKKGVEDIWSNKNLTDEQIKIALSVLSSKFNKSSFINIVEEPEQNLYPSSQQQLLFSLLNLNNLNIGNKLIITTHSPYLINYLTLAIKANKIISNLNNDKLISKLNDYIPLESIIESSKVAIYQFDEIDGSINKLKFINGLPSDSNQLNYKLDEINDVFANLLDIQHQI